MLEKKALETAELEPDKIQQVDGVGIQGSCLGELRLPIPNSPIHFECGESVTLNLNNLRSQKAKQSPLHFARKSFFFLGLSYGLEARAVPLDQNASFQG